MAASMPENHTEHKWSVNLPAPPQRDCNQRTLAGQTGIGYKGEQRPLNVLPVFLTNHFRGTQAVKHCQSARVVLVASFLILASTLAVRADNWPQWRGPDNNGISKEKNLPMEWSDAKNIV